MLGRQSRMEAGSPQTGHTGPTDAPREVGCSAP
jgi:hypothetical protein